MRLYCRDDPFVSFVKPQCLLGTREERSHFLPTSHSMPEKEDFVNRDKSIMALLSQINLSLSYISTILDFLAYF